MESCMCPITQELFEDPVMGDDGHTYERKAITNWLRKNGTSPMTKQPMDIKSLRTNYMAKEMVEESKSMPRSSDSQYQFELDIHIKKTRQKPVFQAFGKAIYEVEWINRDGPPIILLKIDGAKANREASFYVQLSCHPHVVRTYGLVQSKPGSVMLLQEYAPQGDLSELLRENGFKPKQNVLHEIFKQICDAMICLAYNGIVHGDLACRNVLVFKSNPTSPQENLVKLTDFGLTRGSSLYSVVNTPAKTMMTVIPIRYVAPEILRDANISNYSEKSDVYSMGVLMWEACSQGELPYSSLDDDDDVRQKKLNDERLSRPPSCSHQLWIIMNECWHQDSDDRPTFLSLKQLLSNLDSQAELNYDRLQSIDDENQSRSRYVLGSEQQYMNEENLERYQTTDTQKRSHKCPFCLERFPSSAALGDHLLLCGNKTEQCPTCQRFVRRAIFRYHFEDNCAMNNEEETPSSLHINSASMNDTTKNFNALSREARSANDADLFRSPRQSQSSNLSRSYYRDVEPLFEEPTAEFERHLSVQTQRQNVTSTQPEPYREFERSAFFRTSRQRMPPTQPGAYNGFERSAFFRTSRQRMPPTQPGAYNGFERSAFFRTSRQRMPPTQPGAYNGFERSASFRTPQQSGSHRNLERSAFFREQ